MTRRSSPQRANAAIVASERHGSRRPIGKPGTIAESADMPSTLAQIGEALMERRASDSPRRDSAQISIGRRHGARQPFGRLRTIDETAEILNVSSRTSGGLSIPARYLCTDLVGRCAFPTPILRS
jgi:hypothetical protein